MTIQDDTAHRSADVHRPDGRGPTEADLFAYNEVVIHAAPEQIWQHLMRATAWPDWHSNAANVSGRSPAIGSAVTT